MAAFIINTAVRRRNTSPRRYDWYSSTEYTHENPAPDKPDAFVFSTGNATLFSRRKLPLAAPSWNFTTVTYHSEDDDGSLDEDEVKPPVDEHALDMYVNRIILSATMNEEGDTFGISDPYDGIREEPKYKDKPLTKSASDKQGRKKKKNKRRSDGKKESKPSGEEIGPHGLQLPAGTVKGCASNGQVLICMSQDMYRSTVMAEVESRARNMHQYFDYEFRRYDKLKVNALKDCYFWHEKSKQLENIIELKEEEIFELRLKYDLLEKRFEDEQKMKRQRRANKKQRRKAEKTSQSMTDTLTEAADERDCNSHA
ncbi:uncharacterized protein [Haliotis cracherodii]|uniref:uncharacterized protein n=1 Tax=Haliotis cracherodii TaxID=6455 RepID=UPI0039ECBD5B